MTEKVDAAQSPSQPDPIKAMTYWLTIWVEWLRVRWTKFCDGNEVSTTPLPRGGTDLIPPLPVTSLMIGKARCPLLFWSVKYVTTLIDHCTRISSNLKSYRRLMTNQRSLLRILTDHHAIK